MFHKTVILSVLLLSIVVWASAEPTFVYCTSVNNQTYTGAVRPLRSFIAIGGSYYDPDLDKDLPLPGPGDVDINGAVQRSGGYSGENVYNWTMLTGDTSIFYVNMNNFARILTTPRASHANIASYTSINKWFILSGPAGTVHLRQDIVMGGQVETSYSAGGRASAFFTHYMTFLASPEATLRERPLVVNGGAVPPFEKCEASSFSLNGTIPDLCFTANESGNVTGPIDYVIRTNPFTVTAGVPFALSFAGNITVSANAAMDMQSSGFAEFYDIGIATSSQFPQIPELTPEGFVIDLDGDPSTHDVVSLASQGYTIKAFTVPTLTGVSPTTGGPAGYVTLTLEGTGFVPGATAKLVRAGEPEIIAETVDITRYRDTAALALFNLDGRAPGLYDVVLVNDPAWPAESSVSLPAAFSIAVQPGPQAQVWMDIPGSGVRPTSSGYYVHILIGNRGYIDAVGTPVINGIPASATWRIQGLPSGCGPVEARESDAGLIALLLPTIHIAPGATESVVLVLQTPVEPASFKLDLAWE